MERELDKNNAALGNMGDEFNDAEKQTNDFGNEVKKSADRADDAGGRLKSWAAC
jgi:hypothetical protein